MRIIIYGAGGIGSVVGGHLWRAGRQAILIGRANHVRAINENGLRLVTPTGVHLLRIPAVTSPAQIDFSPADVVFLCMKGQDTEKALVELHQVKTDVPVFCLQNGVRNEELAARHFSQVYGVMVRIGAEYLAAGEAACRRDPPGWLIIGRYPLGVDELAESVAQEVRSSGFLVKLSPDVMPYKWGKLMANLGNAIDAITGGEGPEIEIIARAARQELIDCLRQANIRWISQEEVAREWADVNLPLRSSLQTRQHSSTWQSLARRQGSVETDFLNGEVVRLAAKVGRAVPVNTALNRIAQEMAAKRELPGKYTPLQLCSLLVLNCKLG